MIQRYVKDQGPPLGGGVCVCVCVCARARARMLSCALLFAIPWAVACQAPLSMKFSRPEHWSGSPFVEC